MLLFTWLSKSCMSCEDPDHSEWNLIGAFIDYPVAPPCCEMIEKEDRGSWVQWACGRKLNTLEAFSDVHVPSLWPFPCLSLNYSRSLHCSPSVVHLLLLLPPVPPSLIQSVPRGRRGAAPFSRSVFPSRHILRCPHSLPPSLSFCHTMGVPPSKHAKANPFL